VKKGNGEIRRVNINAAPLDIEGFKIVKAVVSTMVKITIAVNTSTKVSP
jgi:hypothetical protein